MSNPLISILVPTHNRRKLLEQTLNSIYHQKEHLDKIEVIISNDGSTDDTKSYLEDLVKKPVRAPLFVHNHESNLGGAGNWRFLLEQAKGDFVYLLSDDDVIKPEFLKEYVDVIKQYPDIDLIYSGIEYCNSTLEKIDQSSISSVVGLVDARERLKNQLKANHMVMSSMYRRSTFLRAGGWQARYGACIDVGAFANMCMCSQKTFFIKEALFCFRLGLESWASYRPDKQKKIYESSRLIIDDVVTWAKKEDRDNLSFYKSCYAHHAQGILNMLDLKTVHEELNKVELRNLLKDLYAVYPESLLLSSFYKMFIVSLFGFRWLETLRAWMGRGILGTSVFDKGYVSQGDGK